MVYEELVTLYVTNLGKYNEGELVGEWLSLPCEKEEIDECLKRIGINEEYEEYFITDYDNNVLNLETSEYINIYELNEKLIEIAELCKEDSDLHKIQALLEYGAVSDVFEIDDSIMEEYEFYEGWTGADWEESLVRDCGYLDNIENSWIMSYITIDYESMAEDDDSIYETEHGILRRY